MFANDSSVIIKWFLSGKITYCCISETRSEHISRWHNPPHVSWSGVRAALSATNEGRGSRPVPPSRLQRDILHGQVPAIPGHASEGVGESGRLQGHYGSVYEVIESSFNWMEFFIVLCSIKVIIIHVKLLLIY